MWPFFQGVKTCAKNSRFPNLFDSDQWLRAVHWFFESEIAQKIERPPPRRETTVCEGHLGALPGQLGWRRPLQPHPLGRCVGPEGAEESSGMTLSSLFGILGTKSGAFVNAETRLHRAGDVWCLAAGDYTSSGIVTIGFVMPLACHDLFQPCVVCGRSRCQRLGLSFKGSIPGVNYQGDKNSAGLKFFRSKIRNLGSYFYPHFLRIGRSSWIFIKHNLDPFFFRRFAPDKKTLSHLHPYFYPLLLRMFEIQHRDFLPVLILCRPNFYPR